MRHYVCGAIVVAASLLVGPAQAADAIFTGTITSTCLLTVGTPGVLTAPNAVSLSSKNAGGQFSTVAVVTTGGVSLSVNPTVAETIRPAGDTGTILWTPTFAVVGSHPSADSGASRSLTSAGIDTMNVNLEGVKQNGGAFAAGAYTSTVTVTCQ